jgi:hypothetical protein
MQWKYSNKHELLNKYVRELCKWHRCTRHGSYCAGCTVLDVYEMSIAAFICLLVWGCNTTCVLDNASTRSYSGTGDESPYHGAGFQSNRTPRKCLRRPKSSISSTGRWSEKIGSLPLCTYLLIYFTQSEYEDQSAKLELDAEPEVGALRLGGEHARPTAGAAHGAGARACLPPLRDTFDMTNTCIGSTAGPGAKPGIPGGEAGGGVGVCSNSDTQAVLSDLLSR